MSARKIDGKAFAEGLRQTIGRRAVVFTRRFGTPPGLAAVLVGENPASQVYVRNKGRQTEEAHMRSFAIHLPEQSTQAELLNRINALNADPAVNGILVQLPLPAQIDATTIQQAVDPEKDVDGFHPVNVGRLGLGLPGFVPCTPAGCLALIKAERLDLTGLKAVVIGRSAIVGKPIAQLLLAENCTVTITHSRTRDLAGECRAGNILIAAVGKPELVRGDWIKPGAIVIDVGINRIPAAGGKTQLVGDVAYDEAATVAGAITPVPGGVGPMTIACLLQNTLLAACRARGIAPTALDD
jgi:methylenetetrahydrofolate dehydrogenase (NADP+)/methenyltetrahydrofolate cyclohydrolase